MLTQKPGFDRTRIEADLKSQDPDRMIHALESVNGRAADPDLFQAILPSLTEALTADFKDCSVYEVGSEFLSHNPDMSALKLLSLADQPDAEKSLGALLQLDLLVIDSMAKPEENRLSPAVQAELTAGLEKLKGRTAENINLVAERILAALRPG